MRALLKCLVQTQFSVTDWQCMKKAAVKEQLQHMKGWEQKGKLPFQFPQQVNSSVAGFTAGLRVLLWHPIDTAAGELIEF